VKKLTKTLKLFENNPYQQKGKAEIISLIPAKDNHTKIVLDQTIFYPTGGGQPHDKGYISNLPVVDVMKEEGVIYHLVKGELSKDLREVELSLNWERRFDHMQQHTGQHILSRVFEILYNADTVGFHLGEEIVTIDVTLKELTQEMVNEVERFANQIIRDKREIFIEYYQPQELPFESIKKIPDLDELVRIVNIKEFDQNPCAGTHVYNTLEVGMIKILNWEKNKENIRVSFVSGNRAYKFFSTLHLEFKKSANLLKTSLENINQSIEHLMQEKITLEKNLKEKLGILQLYEAKEWQNSAILVKECKLIIGKTTERDVNDLKYLAQLITKEPSYLVIFINQLSDKVQLILQRSENLNVPVNKLLASGLNLIDGKGGGNEKAAQGGSNNLAKVDSAIAEMKKHLIELL